MTLHSSNYANILIYKYNKNSGGVISSLKKFTLVNSQSTSDSASTGILFELDASKRAPDEGFFAVTKKEEENLDLQL
jgi:hypothetical protein